MIGHVLLDSQDESGEILTTAPTFLTSISSAGSTRAHYAALDASF